MERIRHGTFRHYHENGVLASEGNYEHGLEHGLWRDYHDNEKLAAEGQYAHGKEVGNWKYWDADGKPDQ